MKDTDNLGPSN